MIDCSFDAVFFCWLFVGVEGKVRAWGVIAACGVMRSSGEVGNKLSN